MSGAIKGYRYVTALGAVIVSRHHKRDLALAFQRTNAHQPLVAYELSPAVPVAAGDRLPGGEGSAIKAILVEEPRPKAPRKGPTYRS